MPFVASAVGSQVQRGRKVSSFARASSHRELSIETHHDHNTCEGFHSPPLSTSSHDYVFTVVRTVDGVGREGVDVRSEAAGQGLLAMLHTAVQIGRASNCATGVSKRGEIYIRAEKQRKKAREIERLGSRLCGQG
eukprot:3485968-Rhodomonas_salina.2